MKKIVTIILALSLILGLALSVSAAAAEETKAIAASEGTMGDKSISWNGTNFKMVNEQDASSSAIRNSDADHFRAYKGSKTTITALNGEKLSKLTITTTGGKYLTALQDSLADVEGVSVTANGDVVTITLTTPVESFAISATGGQWRLSQIVVAYATGECPHAYDGCTDTACNLCNAAREASEHEYTNEYDATCNKCSAGDRTVTLPAADSDISFELAEKLALAGVADVKYYMTGEITEIYQTTYGNMKIKDASGKIFTIYGTYSADGKDRFDAMAKKPVVGDTITVYGVLGTYKGAAQMVNGWIQDEVHEEEGPSETADPSIIALAAMMLPVSGIGLGALCLKRKKED